MAKYALFTVTGVELEYMIVDRETLAVRPLADKLLEAVAGEIVADVERGATAWSNELVNHVVELKTNGPAKSLEGLATLFHDDVVAINKILEPMDAMLLPSGAHPFMDPLRETVIWPHEYNEVYALYNRIFDCRGHGWANLQSTHINLPFANDAEFARLHAAIRLLLPILPAMTASTPMLDGHLSGFNDTRLEVYRTNQQAIPSIAGQVIPEPVFSEADYQRVIFDPIVHDITPYDHDKVLSHYFLNSRGAIARFDRGAIEIRTIDLQECPQADLALVDLVVAVLRSLVAGDWAPLDVMQAFHTAPLAALWRNVVKVGEKTTVDDPAYAALWGLQPGSSVQACWEQIVARVGQELMPASRQHIDLILAQGNLSRRMVQGLGTATREDVLRVYRQLAACLAEQSSYVP